MSQPASAEPINGARSPEDDEDSAEEFAGSNGITARDSRSVSSTVHDRSRPHASAAQAMATGMGTISKQASRHRHSQPHPRPHSAHPQPGSSPPTARETFLNYFFGQNGPGPIAGSSLERSHAGGAEQSIVPVGRDISGAQRSMSAGLMAGKRNMDGNNAAFDMKSLGKHIEAVSYDRICYPSS